MQRYLMNFSTETMRTKRAELLVIGSGVAGLQAAWTAARAGCHVLLVVRDTLWDSNTNKAQGGIAASFGEDDNPELHVQDTLVAGAGLSDEQITRIVTSEGPDDIRRLIEHGAKFDRNADGTLALGREGCHSRSRIVHAKGDATGAEVARALNDMAAGEEKIEVLEHCYVVDLLTEAGRCYGVTALQAGEKICLRAGAVILATGGCGRLFAKTTNPEGATGSGTAMAYRAGAEVMDMEFVQFHPTALALAGCPNFLISEAVRGAGALLRNLRGDRFMPRYHKMAELAPRDVVARCIFQEMQQENADHVWLDARSIGRASQKFPMIARTCREYGVDIDAQMIPIAPAAHYMMGGVKTDAWGRTNLAGLYACGEAACTGLQGANRLASNSLLEGLVFGRRSAKAAVQALKTQPRVPALEWTYGGLRMAEQQKTAACTQQVQETMSRFLGIRRDRNGIRQALQLLQKLEAQQVGTEAATAAGFDLRGRLLLARLIAQAALRREESRGAHFRTDYPEKQERWLQHFTDCSIEEGQSIEGKGENAHGYDVQSGQAAFGMA